MKIDKPEEHEEMDEKDNENNDDKEDYEDIERKRTMILPCQRLRMQVKKLMIKILSRRYIECSMKDFCHRNHTIWTVRNAFSGVEKQGKNERFSMSINSTKEN